MPHALTTVLAFVVVLGVLVFIHEMGHYLAARWRGIHAEAFAVGFGRALWSRTDRRGTVWRVGMLPLGGYVKLHGMTNAFEGDQEAGENAYRQGRAFFEKSVLSRAIVVAAGPLANFALAVVLFTLLFAIAGRVVPRPVVGEVLPGSAAAAAGLQPGDRITGIDGAPITRFEDIQHIVVGAAGRTLTVTLTRGGRTLALPVTPRPRDRAAARPVGMLGITSQGVDTEHLSPGAAVVAGVAQTWEVMRETLSGLWTIIVSGRGSDELGGPLRIAQLSGQVAELGAVSFVNFIALLSINLGLINLFPVPVLDGGHLMFYAAEALRGRPLPERAQAFGQRAGVALIGALFLFATFNDLTHFGLFRWMSRLIG